MSHELALSKDDAMNVMHDLSLVTPETFDRFIVAVLNWYRDEAILEKGIPNLYTLLENQEPYTKIMYDIFVESLAFRQSNTHHAVGSFTPEQQNHFSALFRDNLAVLYQLMVYDYNRLLRALKLTYIWDSSEFGGNEFEIRNNYLNEVW